MRGAALFVAGPVVGLTLRSVVAQNANKGVVMMNHVGIDVPNIPEAIKYYTEKMGYKEAFRADRAPDPDSCRRPCRESRPASSSRAS